MKKTSVAALAWGLSLAACGTNERSFGLNSGLGLEERRPQRSDSASNGGQGGDAADGGSTGFAGETGVDPEPPLDHCDSDDALDAPSVSGVCPPDAAWTGPAPLELDAGSLERMLALTPDELTVVWSSYGSSALAYFVADRSDPSQPFGAPRLIDLGLQVMGVAPDGLRLALRSSDGAVLSEATRSSRDQDFEATPSASYALLNLEAEIGSLSFHDVVFSADDRTLVYTALAEGGTSYPVFLAIREAGAAWPVGQALERCELSFKAGAWRRPTALSSDGLTLFFFDEVRGKARAAWRETTLDAFSWFEDLPQGRWSGVNHDCSRLYIESPTLFGVSMLGREP